MDKSKIENHSGYSYSSDFLFQVVKTGERNVQSLLNIQDIVNTPERSCCKTVPSPVAFVTVRNMKYSVSKKVPVWKSLFFALLYLCEFNITINPTIFAQAIGDE